MSFYEYKVIPAPSTGKKAKGVKGADGRFANTLTETINSMATDGWEYMHAENLPSIERQGLTRKRREIYLNVLVFKRETSLKMSTESIEKTQSFNPFKNFTAKKEPILSSTDDLEVITHPLEDNSENSPEDKL